MRCAHCDEPTGGGTGGVLRYMHVGEWSEHGVREVADANLTFCAGCSHRVLKHMKRVLSRSQLGTAKERLKEVA